MPLSLSFSNRAAENRNNLAVPFPGLFVPLDGGSLTILQNFCIEKHLQGRRLDFLLRFSSFVAVVITRRLLWQQSFADSNELFNFFRDIAALDAGTRSRLRYRFHLEDSLVMELSMDLRAAQGRAVCTAPGAVQ